MSQLHFEQSDVEQVWIGDSGEPGPTVAILGGIHGDETAGVHIIDSLQKTLAVDCGRVILALGNPLAVHRGVRYVDQDLNRSFRPLTDIEATVEPSRRSREVQRAQNLMPLLALANGGTYDMHEQHRDGPTLIITEPSGFRTARAIGADVISSGWSTTEPGGTDSFANNQGFIGICHERVI
jgi:predicted deacylase